MRVITYCNLHGKFQFLRTDNFHLNRQIEEKFLNKHSSRWLKIFGEQMIKFRAENEAEDVPRGSICVPYVDLIQDYEHAISSHVAASPNFVLSITATLGNILFIRNLNSYLESQFQVGRKNGPDSYGWNDC